MAKLKLIVVPFIFLGLLCGILSGLFRIGWHMPISSIAIEHGGFILGSFLGTVVLIERVVPMGKKALILFPFLNGLSSVFFILGMRQLAFYMLAIGAAGLVFIYIIILKKHKENYYYLMMLGALCWFTGNILMISKMFYPLASSWWIAFILLTVFGERLELSKFLPKSKGKSLFMYISLGVYFVGLILPFHSYGSYVQGMGFLLLALWLLKYDMIRISIKKPGIHRYLAVNLLAGYIWMIVMALSIFLPFGGALNYDTLLHCFFLGFTFSMIFAHGPIILPGLLKLPFKPFHNMLYIWTALLQLSILIRVTSNYAVWVDLRKWSGMLSTTAIVFYLVNLIAIVALENKKVKALQA